MKKKKKKPMIALIKVFLVSILIFCSINVYKSVSHRLNVHRVSNNIVSATNENNLNKENSKNTVSTEDREGTNNNYDEYIKTEGSINDNTLSYLKNKLALVPNNILDAFFNQGGTILLTDKNIAKTYYNDYNIGKIIGLHDANKNVVYVSNTKYAIDFALIHEFGHVLDSLTNWNSMKDEFKDIYNTEKDTLEVYSIDGHYKTNEREFFAEIFQESIINSDSCKKTAPRAFEFVTNKINELK